MMSELDFLQLQRAAVHYPLHSRWLAIIENVALESTRAVCHSLCRNGAP